MNFLSLSGGAIGGIVGGAVALLVVIIVIWYISARNKFVALKNDVEEAYSAMDVHMKKRYDLIPNLVSTCKGYSKHESETMTRVTQARAAAIGAATPEQKAVAERELGASLHTLLNAVVEQYPNLKADTQFNNLSAQLENCEHEIGNSRKYYNAKVKLYNNKIEMFPSSIVAGRMRLERKPYFEIDEEERAVPRVSFDDAI